MAQASTVNVYRVEMDNKYGWFASTFPIDHFDRVITNQLAIVKRRGDQLTEIQQELSKHADDYSGVHPQLIGMVGREDIAGRARMILNDLRSFAPERVFGQRVAGLYFAHKTVDNRDMTLNDLLALMQKYPQVKFGWPADEEEYRQQLAGDGDREYVKLRAQALKYWFDQSRGDLSWLYADSAAKNNYRQTFEWLKQNAPKLSSWYYDRPSGTTGMIWHFTDINNMANILSYQEITSKNYGLKNSVIRNDNAASSVNDAATKPWVHDYARFYLRPQTPTQYRNEGIYQYYGEHPDFRNLPKSLVNRDQSSFWTNGRPAHLPVPVFIGFSLEKFLRRGGHLTKGSLAGKRVTDQPEGMFDDDFAFLREHVQSVYSTQGAPNYLKHTEFIFPEKMEFEGSDILRIVVRSEAEKLVLLTMLTEHDSFLFSNKQAHQKIDPQRYLDRIVVDPSFFNYNGSSVQTGGATDDKVNQYHLCLKPPVAPDNLTREEQPYAFSKIVNGNELRVTVPKLKQVTLKVKDVNGEQKIVARFHDPDWILGTSKWIPSKKKREISAARGYRLGNRYYSTLYYHGRYFKVWREEGSDTWHLVGSNQVANFMTPADQEILRTIEESCSEEFVELPDNSSLVMTPTNSRFNMVPSEPSAPQPGVVPPQPSTPQPDLPIPPAPFDLDAPVSSVPDDHDTNDDDDFLLF